jgi:Fic family protein
VAPTIADIVAASEREFLKSHPWITFRLDLRSMPHTFWEYVGEARSKCRHLAFTPLKPAIADQLHTLYLAKGVHATTAIEGNTLSEDQVHEIVQGKLELPPSQEYLQRETENIAGACSEISQRVADGEFTLTLALLKELNFKVLDGLDVEDHVLPGEFTKARVGVARYRGAPPEDAEFLTGLLVDWLNRDEFRGSADKRERFLFAVLRAVVAHIYIAWIHPFGDGNGRTARLIEFAILTDAGIPSPAAHLFSNHYNLTRSAYYRHLAESSRSGGDLTPFLVYALEGLVDQLQIQLDHVHDSILQVSWENYVHEQFHDRHGLTARRQRDLVLALSDEDEPVARARLRRLTPALAEAYAGKQNKTVTRDVNVLLELGLIERAGTGRFKARRELMFSFMPHVHTPLVI